MGLFRTYDLLQDGEITTAKSNIAVLSGSIISNNSNISGITGNITVNLDSSQNLSNKNFLIPSTMGTNLTASGVISSYTAGQTFAFGQVGILTSSGTVWKADANVSGLFPADVVAIEAITSGSSGRFLRLGTIRDDSWTWTIGGLIYLSTTLGGMTQTQPSATDECIQILGKAFPNADTIQFSPNLFYITHT